MSSYLCYLLHLHYTATFVEIQTKIEKSYRKKRYLLEIKVYHMSVKEQLTILWLDDQREPYKYFAAMEKDKKKNKELSNAARIRVCGTSSSNGREKGFN